jgi:threonyl-tRNA synthetase
MLVVGDREVQSRGVAVRRRNKGDAGSRAVNEFISALRELIDTRAATW